MTQESSPPGLRDAFERLARHDIRQTALVAFAIGVLFHVCVVYAVLGSGGSPSSSPTETRQTTPAPAVAVGTPTPLPDRTNCADIRGSEYRSDNERQWFIRNCTGG